MKLALALVSCFAVSAVAREIPPLPWHKRKLYGPTTLLLPCTDLCTEVVNADDLMEKKDEACSIFSELKLNHECRHGFEIVGTASCLQGCTTGLSGEDSWLASAVQLINQKCSLLTAFDTVLLRALAGKGWTWAISIFL